MARNITEAPQWDLSDLFRSPKDKRIERELHAAEHAAQEFQRRYNGKLAAKALNAQKLLTALEEYEQLQQRADKPQIYAALRFAEKSDDHERGAFLQHVRTETIAIHNLLVFFPIEVLKRPDRELRTLAKHPSLSRFRNYLQRLIESRPHLLSEREEQILSQCDLTGRGAFLRLFDEELSRKKFRMQRGGKERQLTETEVLDLLRDADRRTRQAAAQSLTDGLKEEMPRLVYITNVLAQDKAIEDKLRGYDTPEASRHLANEISQEMVDVMTGAVCAKYDLVAHYYGFKKRLLKLRSIYDYDRYAPLPGADRDVSWNEARNMVLEAFGRFSPRYGEIAELFFSKGWIDAAVQPGKRGGAFCSFVTADHHPYVFMNFVGRVDDVFTLAHELGHAIHAYLAREQGYINFAVPLTVAETASVFSELLLFNYLRETSRSKTVLLDMLLKRIEGIFATVFRQVSMYRFEQDLHAARRSQGELAAEDICKLWRTRQEEMFGGSVVLTENYDYWWSYIPHFLHTPFYVYAYAFGELLTLGLFRIYRESGAGFVDSYMALLSAGDSKSPGELVKPLGIRLDRLEFWNKGLALVEELVDEARELA